MKSQSNSSFARWQRLLKSELADETDPKRFDGIRRRLKQFPFLKSLKTEQDIRDTLSLISQGRALLRAAIEESLEYQAPEGKRLSPARRARVVQWRFVMAFSGVETLSRGLILPRSNTWTKPRFGQYIREMDGCLKLTKKHPLEPVVSPKHGNARPSKVREEFFAATNLTEGGKMARTLNLNKFDVKLLGDWINGEHALESWADRLNVAKALRNCTVHGALSADKAHKLGFIPALTSFTTDLDRFANEVFVRLVE